MKKKILFVFATALLISGALTVKSVTKDASKILFEANFEALSQSESDEAKECWDTITGKPSFWAGKGYCK